MKSLKLGDRNAAILAVIVLLLAVTFAVVVGRSVTGGTAKSSPIFPTN